MDSTKSRFTINKVQKVNKRMSDMVGVQLLKISEVENSTIRPIKDKRFTMLTKDRDAGQWAWLIEGFGVARFRYGGDINDYSF